MKDVLPSKYPDLDELAFERFWGVWCVNDRAWCPITEPFLGRQHEAAEELKHWASGERAAVNPKNFTYEVRFNIRAALRAERTRVDTLRLALRDIGVLIAEFEDNPGYVMLRAKEIVDEYDTTVEPKPRTT